MIRRLGIAAALLVALLAATLGAAVVYRGALAERLLLAGLARAGVPAARLTVAELDTRHLRLTGVSLGTAGELRVEAVTVRYHWQGLRARRIDGLELEGAVLRVDLGFAAAPLGSLQPLLAAGGGGAPPETLPAIDIRRARLEARSPLGPLTIDLEGEIRPAGATGLSATFSFSAASGFARLSGIAGVASRDRRRLTGELLIDDGALTLPGADIGGMTGKVDFTLGGGGSAPFGLASIESLAAGLALSDLALQHTSFETARLTLAFSGERLTVEARLREAGERLAAVLGVALERILTAPRLELTLEASLSAEAELWRALDLPAPQAGRGLLSLALRGDVAPLTPLPRDRDAVLTWLAASTLAGSVRLAVEQVDHDPWVEGLDGDLDLDVALESGVLSLTPVAAPRLEAKRLLPEALDALAVPAALRPLIARGLSIVFSPSGKAGVRVGRYVDRGDARLEAQVSLDGAARLVSAAGLAVAARGRVEARLGESFEVGAIDLPHLTVTLPALSLAGQSLSRARFAGAVSGRPGAWRGSGQLELELPELLFGQLNVVLPSARLPIAVELAKGRLEARLEAPGRLAAKSLSYGAGARLRRVPELEVLAARLALDWPPRADGVLEHSLSLAPSVLDLELDRADGGPLVIAAESGRVALEGRLTLGGVYQGALTIAGARLALPQYDLDLDQVAATVNLGPGGPGRPGGDSPLVRFTVGALRHTAEPPLVVPLRLEGEFNKSAEGVVATATGGAQDGAWRASLRARYDFESGGGTAQVRLDDLVFSPRRLQPAQISPLLADLKRVSGGLSALATLAWGADGLNGSATVALGDLAFTLGEVAVEGLDSRLVFDSLRPLSTAPAQTVRVRRVEVGLALHDLTLQLSVPPGEPLRLLIERAEIDFAGGKLAVADALLEPGASRQRFVLTVSALDLARLFELVDVAGLSGSGTISGAIPVAFEDGAVVIRDGRLGVAGAGAIRFRSERAAAALESGGAPVQLMLEALRDFRYDELTLAVDKTATEDLSLALHILGHNPKVLDGHPFAININLSANIASLLAALREGTALTDVFIRRLPENGD